MTNLDLDDDAADLQNGASDGQQQQQPSRSEFNALLGRMQILEQQCQQHQNQPAVNNGENGEFHGRWTSMILCPRPPQHLPITKKDMMQLIMTIIGHNHRRSARAEEDRRLCDYL